MEFFGYRKLVAYSKAKEVVKFTYQFIHKFPQEERYALGDQLRRASVSVTSNIAEGMSRFSLKDRIHFLEIAHGSLMETMSQLEVALDLGYISGDDFNYIEELIKETSRLISGLQNSYKETNAQK